MFRKAVFGIWSSFGYLASGPATGRKCLCSAFEARALCVHDGSRKVIEGHRGLEPTKLSVYVRKWIDWWAR